MFSSNLLHNFDVKGVSSEVISLKRHHAEFYIQLDNTYVLPVMDRMHITQHIQSRKIVLNNANRDTNFVELSRRYLWTKDVLIYDVVDLFR